MVGLLKKAGLAVLFLVGLSACDKSMLDGERTADQGSLVARLHTVPGVSKAAQVELEAPPIERFVVAVRSAAAPAEPVYTSLFSEFPYSINLTEGSYTIEADQGQNLPFVIENPYYRAEQSFTIERGEATSVELKARLVGFGVEGFFDADMADHFTSWQLEAEIDDVWDESYRWAEQGNKPRAYFLPGTVRVILRGVRHNGEPFSKVIKEIRSTGRELYTLNIHVSPAGHALSVSVDTERRLVTDQGVVSVDALPDLESPTLGAMTFYETTTVPADGLAATAELHSFVGFSQVTITVPKAAYGLEARAYRWSDGADRAALRAAGVDLGADDLSAVRTATLSAKGLVNTMLADASVEREYDLAVAVTDGTGKAVGTTLPIRIERPEFTLPTDIAGYVWSKSLDLPTPVVEQGDLSGLLAHSGFAYQWSADGVQWSDVVTQGALSGLIPGTQYYVRARFRDQTTAAVPFTTETPAQIPGSKFDAWTSTNPMKNNPRNFVSDGSWWASSNSMTCHSSGTNAFYVSMSGVRPLSGGISGTHAALYTIGWGSGNTCNFGGLSGSTINNISAGTLFLGSHDGSIETLGKPFAAKPTAMKFYYKYDPFNGDKATARIYVSNGSVILGEGVFKASDVQNSFVEKTLTVVYDPTYKHLPVTSICIYFKSGDNEGDASYLREMYDYGGLFYSGRASQGSKFYVDDIELIYDK